MSSATVGAQWGGQINHGPSQITRVAGAILGGAGALCRGAWALDPGPTSPATPRPRAALQVRVPTLEPPIQCWGSVPTLLAGMERHWMRRGQEFPGSRGMEPLRTASLRAVWYPCPLVSPPTILSSQVAPSEDVGGWQGPSLRQAPWTEQWSGCDLSHCRGVWAEAAWTSLETGQAGVSRPGQATPGAHVHPRELTVVKFATWHDKRLTRN